MMDIARERHILELVEAALEHPAIERERFLHQRTGDDRSVLSDALDLLRAAENVDLPTALPMSASGLETPPPERIGPYRIGQLLGRGGMGRVFAAERVDGMFEQSVAIKLMNRTLLSSIVTEQFVRERQILARLQHRNIAQLFDGGITADGHSYFVMELVTGRTIMEYAQAQQLTLVDTIRVFMQICAALQYAHSRLVVHADIKPNNILVTEDGSAKLLDFGVAHVLSANDENKLAPLGLTQAYASPARRRGDPPTTADDVYSLGVLLEELLARIGEVPPDVQSIYRRARTEDADSRYASVEALRRDLQRWLDHRPVAAHGGRWHYVARKLFTRHRLAASTAAAGTAMLIIAAIGLAFLYQRAESARSRADERFVDARQLSHYVLFDVYDRLESIPRALVLRRDIADAAQRYLDRLAHDPGAPLDIRIEVIEGLRRLAQVQAEPGSANLQQSAQARANLERAVELAEALPQDNGGELSRELVLARLQLTRARLATTIDQDMTSAQRALDACRLHLDNAARISSGNEEIAALRLDHAVQQAATFQWQGEYQQAITTARAALDRVAYHGNASKTDRTHVLQRARLFNILAESIYYAGDVTTAERYYRDQYETLTNLIAVDMQDIAVERALGIAAWQLGTTLLELKRNAEAEPMLSKGRSLYERLVELDPADRDLARGLDVISNAHAQSLAAILRYAEAIPILERSVAVRHAKWSAAPADWSAARDYTISLAMLADVRSQAGFMKAACNDYALAIQTFDRIRAAGKLSKLDQEYSLPLALQGRQKHCS
jgi:serine/threonine protein kinase